MERTISQEYREEEADKQAREYMDWMLRAELWQLDAEFERKVEEEETEYAPSKGL